ncbi:pregnancy-specific glycoprotein 22-like [Hyperolius riggenbachi]|uniref:pregnancy-specific glycoprotein 22-like n=1 Tax=Hyperolius riggenbachi TaxID=752182 RepID=UPI0035A2ED23
MASSRMSAVQASVLAVTLYACINMASGIDIEVVPPNPNKRSTVVLNVTGITGGKIRFATWYRGQSTNASDQILNFFPPATPIKGSKYFSDAQGQANGSLVITNVQKDYSGYYTVQVQTDVLQQKSVELLVNGIGIIGLSPLAVLLGMLLCSELNLL